MSQHTRAGPTSGQARPNRSCDPHTHRARRNPADTVSWMLNAVLWDFGGVILSSPFEAFGRYERANGLPEGAIRTINSTNPDDNAWAKLERSEVDAAGFCALFDAEGAGLGYAVDGRQVLAMLEGEVRPQMVEALRRVKAHFKTACLTNNVLGGMMRPDIVEVMNLFDVVVESSKVGARKPEPVFYEQACALLDVQPEHCVFLDDLGINLKPARAMGMQTIKVGDPDVALAELEVITGLTLR
jgi:putative hydrolase of the HAD superfamily